MRHINYTVNNKFTSFVPTHILETNTDSEIGAWIPMNKDLKNFLNPAWCDTVHSIIKVSDELIYVIFNESHYENSSGGDVYDTALYKGELK